MNRRITWIGGAAALVVSAAVLAARAPWPDAAVRGPGGRTAPAADGWIYFAVERGGRQRVERVRPDGSGLALVSASAPRSFPGAPSRDGATVLVVQSRDDSTGHFERVLAVSSDGRAERPLTVWSGRQRNPAWSPDGARIAYESDEHSFGDVVTLDVATRTARTLTRGTAGHFEPAWSPDGATIAYVASVTGNAELYTMPAAGGASARLTASARDSWGPRWSPDGRRLAFTSNRSMRDRVYVMERDGTRLRPVTGRVGEQGGASEFEGEGAPVWSPDGQVLLLLARRPGESTRLWRVRPGEPPVPISPAGSTAGAAAWSPDGAHVAWSLVEGPATGVFVSRADGSGARRLEAAGDSAWLPVWGR